MKKLLLVLFLVMISFNSYAEWSLVVTSTNKNEYYIDFDRVSKNNGYVYYWVLSNFPSPPYAKGKSSLELYEVNCSPPIKERRKAYYFYNSAMVQKGTRSSVFDTSTGPWEYSVPGSVQERLIEAVC